MGLGVGAGVPPVVFEGVGFWMGGGVVSGAGAGVGAGWGAGA